MKGRRRKRCTCGVAMTKFGEASGPCKKCLAAGHCEKFPIPAKEESDQAEPRKEFKE